ncbi:MAG TPA: VCBS repeat-containing protein [Candidatus Udaeobacter sp.]|nr:VCBS repeat-containing protein [Candidatus Udaeobacter sp.]
MKKLLYPLDLFFRHAAFAFALFSALAPAMAEAADRGRPPVNEYGAPVLDAKGQRVTYDQKKLESMARAKGHLIDMSVRPFRLRIESVTPPPRPQPTPFPRPTPQPPRSGPNPFWQYAVFGANIGGSNIIVDPVPSGRASEIIFDSYSYNPFWQSIRYNATTGNYDQIFVSPSYNSDPFSYVSIRGLQLGKVTNASERQIVVMLDDGRVYIYDFASKGELAHFDTGVAGYYGLAALTISDLDGDGLAELILTTGSDLFVFSSNGELLWQVPGAGGYDVVAGQMDNDPAIEIATTNGFVIDAGTHAAQWTYGGGFGVHLKLAPFPGENYQQLISAAGWQFVYSYDVARQLPRWSISTPQDIGAIKIADVDNDGVPEVIIGDGQWGTVHVHDLLSQALKWEVNNPEHGVTNIAVGDVDHDGVPDLLWGAGATSSGADHLYVASTTGTHDIKWQSIDLEGPFLGPAIGDLDGDGRPELIVCSSYSDATYGSGRILVFDSATLTLRAISNPVVDNGAWTGVHDLKLRDVEGNGRMQILIAADSYYDGAIEIYRFNPDNTFTRIWTNATRPFGNPFNFVEVADLDNNGTLKIIAANTVAHTGSDGVYVYAYDYPSGEQSWRSVALSSGFSSVIGLITQDLDGDGNKEIAALTNSGDLYTWDGPSRELRNLRQGTNGTLLSDRASAAGLVLGDITGSGHFLRWNGDAYTENFTRQLATNCDPYGVDPCINGLNVTADNSLWTGTGSILTQRAAPTYDNVTWQSPEIGGGLGRFVATTVRNGQDCVFSSDQQAVIGLTIAPPSTPTPTPHPRVTPRPRATPPGRP